MNTTIRRSDDVFTTPFEDTLLMMSVQQGKYFGLNGVATRIWSLLEKPTTAADLVERLVAEYEVSSDLCAEQVAAFLAALRERKLLVDAE